MSGIQVARLEIEVPANGESQQFSAAGRRVIIEEAPEVDPVEVPTLHFGSADGDGIPIIRRAQFANREGWDTFHIRGNGGGTGGKIFLVILQDLQSLLELPEA